MTRLFIFAGTTIGGYLGWYLGDAAGWGFGGAFLISGLGSLVGVWAGWKIARKLDE